MYQVHNVCVKSVGLIVHVIQGNPRHCRTEDDLPGLSVDVVQFPRKLHTAAEFKAIRVRQDKEGSEMPNTYLSPGSKEKFLLYYQEKQGETSWCVLSS